MSKKYLLSLLVFSFATPCIAANWKDLASCAKGLIKARYGMALTKLLSKEEDEMDKVFFIKDVKRKTLTGENGETYSEAIALSSKGALLYKIPLSPVSKEETIEAFGSESSFKDWARNDDRKDPSIDNFSMMTSDINFKFVGDDTIYNGHFNAFDWKDASSGLTVFNANYRFGYKSEEPSSNKRLRYSEVLNSFRLHVMTYTAEDIISDNKEKISKAFEDMSLSDLEAWYKELQKRINGLEGCQNVDDTTIKSGVARVQKYQKDLINILEDYLSDDFINENHNSTAR